MIFNLDIRKQAKEAGLAECDKCNGRGSKRHSSHKPGPDGQAYFYSEKCMSCDGVGYA